MRIPRPTTTGVIIALQAIAFPLIWWGSPLLVALCALLGLGALLLSIAAHRPSSAASTPESATAAPSPAPSQANIPPSPHQAATTILVVGFALMAFASGIDNPVLSAKVALSSLLVSRVLLVVLPARFGEFARLAAAHGSAFIAAALMVEPTQMLTCALWQAVWLAVDFSRVRFIAPAQAGAETSAAAASSAQDAPPQEAPLSGVAQAEASAATPANDSAETSAAAASDAQDTPPQEAPLSGVAQADASAATPANDSAGADAAAASEAQDAPLQEAPLSGVAQAEASAATPANDSAGSEDGDAGTKPSQPIQPRRRPNLVQVGGAAAAAVAIAVLISIGIVQTIAPVRPQQSADASPRPDFDELWNQSPWVDRRPAVAAPQPPPLYGSVAWACAQAATLAAHGLHTLTAHDAAAGDGSADADWAPAIQHFDTPPLALAAPQSADRVFGSACPGDANVRVIAAGRVRAASGYRGHEASDIPFVVGAIHTLDLPDGRQLLVARAWHDTDDFAPSYLLMAWAQQSAAEPSPAIWVVSNKGSMGVAGVIFAPAAQPLGGYHLWYGAMGVDGALSTSSADILDISGSAPRNTGPIPVWGASKCGQVPGDLLEPAEPDCAEQPAWAFWLTDFQYAPDGADEVVLTWRVRRQFATAGEPATYEEAFEETMRGRFIMSSGHWRFVGGEGELLADAGFVVSPN